MRTIAEIVVKLVSGAAGFLFNCPLDMIIETTRRRDFPALREAQFCGVFSLAQDGRNATFHEEIRNLTPAGILRHPSSEPWSVSRICPRKRSARF